MDISPLAIYDAGSGIWAELKFKVKNMDYKDHYKKPFDLAAKFLKDSETVEVHVNLYTGLKALTAIKWLNHELVKNGEDPMPWVRHDSFGNSPDLEYMALSHPSMISTSVTPLPRPCGITVVNEGRLNIVIGSVRLLDSLRGLMNGVTSDEYSGFICCDFANVKDYHNISPGEYLEIRNGLAKSEGYFVPLEFNVTTRQFLKAEEAMSILNDGLVEKDVGWKYLTQYVGTAFVLMTRYRDIQTYQLFCSHNDLVEAATIALNTSVAEVKTYMVNDVYYFNPTKGFEAKLVREI